MASLSARTLAIAIGTVIAGAGALALGRVYHRPAPAPDVPPAWMTVGSDNVALTEDAPAWSSLTVGHPSPATARWSQGVPAHVTFDEARTSRIGAPLGGRVTAVFVERGQAVKAGAPLYTVASAGLADMRADLARASVERATAKANLDRVQALVDAGSLAAKELETAKAQFAEADLAVRAAGEKLASLKVSESGSAQFTVTAPRAGYVVEKTINVGQQIDASTASTMAIADLADVWVIADVFESDVRGIAQGTPVKVLVGSDELEGTVDQVSAVVDPDKHTVPVRITLANPKADLRPNSYAQVRFLASTTAAVTIPSTAVLSDGEHAYVYAKTADGALQRRVITVASTTGADVPVLSGLTTADTVVLSGSILLDNEIKLRSE
ncbi:MAG TPA: efflux RND transporter periplasmic adaptor subunit [Kofleriaceae bacterium]|jgi:RND family efflux transporter MFP subunit